MHNFYMCENVADRQIVFFKDLKCAKQWFASKNADMGIQAEDLFVDKFLNVVWDKNEERIPVYIGFVTPFKDVLDSWMKECMSEGKIAVDGRLVLRNE